MFSDPSFSGEIMADWFGFDTMTYVSALTKYDTKLTSTGTEFGILSNTNDDDVDDASVGMGALSLTIRFRAIVPAPAILFAKMETVYVVFL